MIPSLGAGTALFPAALLLCLACAPPDPGGDDAPSGLGTESSEWRGVVESDRTFAAASRESGRTSALLRFLRDDGILFRPRPLPGIAALQADAPEDEGILLRTPEVAGLSEDGLLGFTSGPWRSGDRDGFVTGSGRYVTLWVREPGGEFRVGLEVDVPGPGVEPFPDTLPVRRARVMATRPVLGGRTLLEADSALQVTYRDPDAGSLGGLAFPAGLRILRRGRDPARGPAAFLAAAREAADRGGLIWTVEGSQRSPDGTLGYVYGMASVTSSSAAPPAPFLRIWARGPDGAWQLLLDLLDLPEEGS